MCRCCTWTRGLFECVLVNLLENAVKHTGSHAATRSPPNWGEAVRITVDDEGPGLPPGRRRC